MPYVHPRKKQVSVSGASNRRRGHSAERAVVKYLRENGFPDAVTTRNTGGAGGRQVGDVSFAPGVCLEAKDVKVPAWPAWLRQAIQEAGQDRIPVVVQRLRGKPDVGEWPAVVPRLWWLKNGNTPAHHLAALRGDYGKWLNLGYAAVADDQWTVTRFWRVAEAFRLDQ